MMILRRCVIEGFRGSPKRLEVELSPSLTAMYGPTYTGKSTVLDAITFCLLSNSGAEARDILSSFKEAELVHVRSPKAVVSEEFQAP